jgi:hypothetical protein
MEMQIIVSHTEKVLVAGVDLDGILENVIQEMLMALSYPV